MQTVYGIINSEGTHTDTSNSLLGAKQYATRNGYKEVSKRMGYTAVIIAVKTSKGWVNFGSEEHKQWQEKNKINNPLTQSKE